MERQTISTDLDSISEILNVFNNGTEESQIMSFVDE